MYNNSAYFITKVLSFIIYCSYNLREIRAQENINKY